MTEKCFSQSDYRLFVWGKLFKTLIRFLQQVHISFIYLQTNIYCIPLYKKGFKKVPQRFQLITNLENWHPLAKRSFRQFFRCRSLTNWFLDLIKQSLSISNSWTLNTLYLSYQFPLATHNTFGMYLTRKAYNKETPKMYLNRKQPTRRQECNYLLMVTGFHVRFLVMVGISYWHRLSHIS